MVLGMVSCGKDDNSSTVDGLPTFTTLYSYIGRSDIENIKSEFTRKGYDVNMEYSVDMEGNYIEGDIWIVAEKEDVDGWDLDIEGGKVISVRYSYQEKVKELLISKLNEEKQFRNQSTLTEYRGGILFEYQYYSNLESTDYLNKDELIAALQNISLTSVVEGYSDSYYPDIKTSFEFGDGGGFTYGIEKL